VDAVSKSNYVVGICTPIALGEPSLTIEVSLEGSDGEEPSDSVTLPYSVASLDGNVTRCDAQDIAHAQLTCDGDDCEMACIEMECGCDGSAVCGSCGPGSICSSENLCVPGTGHGPGEESCVQVEGARGIGIDEIHANQGVGIVIATGGDLVEPGARNGTLVGDRPLTVRAAWHLEPGFVEREILAVLELDGVRYEDQRPVAEASDFSRWEGSFNWEVPGAAVLPGSTYSVSLFEVESGHSGEAVSSLPNRLPRSGVAELGVPTGRTRVDLTLVPVTHSVGSCSSTPEMGSVLAAYEDVLYATYPINEMEVRTREQPLVYGGDLSGNGWVSLLSQISQLRAADNAAPNTFYYGVLVPCSATSGIAGIGYAPGNPTAMGAAPYRTGVGIVSNFTFVHEFGHNHGRRHVACSGGEASPEPNYPHPGGIVNHWGWDLRDDSIKTPSQPDFMSYCGNEWISDWGWDTTFDVLVGIESWAGDASAMARAELEVADVLVGILQDDGEEIWWTERSLIGIEGGSGGNGPDLGFFAGDILLDSQAAEYVELSDDHSVIVRSRLPDAFDSVTSIDHVAARGISMHTLGYAPARVRTPRASISIAGEVKLALP